MPNEALWFRPSGPVVELRDTDGTDQRTAELVIAERRARDGKRVARIEFIVAKKVVKGPVQVVSARFRHHVDHAPGP